MFGVITVCMALSTGQPAATTNKIVKETFGAGGKTRTYYLFVPQTATQDRLAQLLVLLHGSGRDGRTLMDMQERRRSRVAAPFLALGVAFLAIGIGGQRAFLTLGIVFLVLGLVRLIRR